MNKNVPDTYKNVSESSVAQFFPQFIPEKFPPHSESQGSLFWRVSYSIDHCFVSGSYTNRTSAIHHVTQRKLQISFSNS